MELKDSGVRREFDSGATKDVIIWKAIPGYEGFYEVSNNGEIRSLYRNTRNHDSYGILKKKTDTHGYYRVNLYKDKNCSNMLVSRAVALAFIPNPLQLPYVGHMNDIKKDNRVENLYWTNASENLTHNNLHLKIAAKRNIENVKKALSKPVVGISPTGETIYFPSMQAAEKAGFQSGKISLCVNGKRKHHKNYEWRLTTCQ